MFWSLGQFIKDKSVERESMREKRENGVALVCQREVVISLSLSQNTRSSTPLSYRLRVSVCSLCEREVVRISLTECVCVCVSSLWCERACGVCVCVCVCVCVRVCVCLCV